MRLLVLNAGSSSLKFSVSLDEPPQPLLRGHLEGLLTEPRFVARDASCRHWREGVAGRDKLGHPGAIEFLFPWGRGGSLSGMASSRSATASCMAA